MKAKIEIDLDNEAFERLPNAEFARILEDLADRLRGSEFSGPGYTLFLRYPEPLIDLNGNTVGYFELKE